MGDVVKAIAGIVLIAAVIIFAPYIAPVLASIGFSTAVAAAIATAVVTTVVSIGASLIFSAIRGGNPAPSAKAQIGPPQVFRQSITDSFIVYGKRRVGGLLVFFHAKQVGDDHYRYFVIAVAGHHCKQVVDWMLGDTVVSVDGGGAVTSGDYAGAAWLWFQNGAASETANATFVAECDGNWTSAHKGSGVAAIYAKFKMTDAAVQAGMPNITAVIEGRDEIADPRTGVTGYSRNAALVFYDWIALPREEGGFGAFDDEIPLASWVSAQANVCDEIVNGVPRYAFDCYLTTGSAPSEVRDSMVVNCAGTYTYSGGKHLMRPGYWVPVTADLSESDLAGAIQVSPFLASDAAATEVQGTFIDPANGYQGSPFKTWDRPGATSIQQVDLDLAFTTSIDQANRIAAIMGKRAACEKTVVWPMNIAGLGLTALQHVQLDSDRYGLSNYAWEISNFTFSADFGVVLSLREENAEIYDDGELVTPASVPAIQQPSGPLLTVTATQQALRSTYPQGLSAGGHDAGSSAYIALSAFTMRYPGADVAIAAPANLTGLAYSSTYYLYCDVTGPGDGAPAFGATTVYATALNSTAHPLRVFLNQAITTPASGGGATGGSGGYTYGGGGGGQIP